MLLTSINNPTDLKNLTVAELKLLAKEARVFLINSIGETGGHLASNLGVVELTLALHYVFCSPQDKILWDVGHQAYVHKILTDRRHKFATLRKQGGLSGFPKISESEHDVWETGHSSTTLGAALGMAVGRDLKGEDGKIIAVIGDGALTAGMAFEGLNQLAQYGRNVLVVVNDNGMSISPNVGALAKHLKTLASKNSAEGNFFKTLNLNYYGPSNGHNLTNLITELRRASSSEKANLLHLCTKKGYGYDLAEKDPVKYHGVGPFNPAEDLCAKTKQSLTYAEVFERTVLNLAETDKRIVLITPAMLAGSCLERFKEKYPTRCFDVGIAEQHAVTFAAGLAIAGLKPIVVIYSTFLQRAYDQVVHDVCMPGLNVTFAIDRAGLVGEDGETHHGLYDIGFLRSQPKLVLMMPKDGSELEQMVKAAVQYDEGPIAVRYPKGSCNESVSCNLQPVAIGRAEVLSEGADLTIFALGPMVALAQEVASLIREQCNIKAAVLNVRFIKPLDEKQLLNRAAKPLIILEENAQTAGLGSSVLEFYNKYKLACDQIKIIGVPEQYVEHASRKEQLAQVALTKENVYREVLNVVQKM